MKCLSDLDSHLTWSLFCLKRRWLFERVLCLPGWPQISLYVAEDLEYFELLILLPILPGIIGMFHHALLLCLTFTLVLLVLPVSSKAGFI